MKIIFVRHGSTALNEVHVYQKPEEPLSEEGFRQVKRVAERLKGANADLIISSKCRRAVQTAQAISQATGKRIIYTKLLNEGTTPSEFHGKTADAESIAHIHAKMRAHAADPKWHYSDEENLFDIKNRALKVLKYLESKKAGTLIVVTHGLLMRMIIFVGIFGKDADVVDSFLRFRASTGLHNTGITECEITENGFKLFTYNDRAHLQKY